MSDLDLEALDRMFLRGSPGPWEAVAALPARCDIEPSVAAGIDPADAALIVAARNALPALIDAARERDQVVAAVSAWAAANEIAAPPLDWAWLGEILRRYDPAHAANTRESA